jgi:crotonobetainyl-CoA:carnitine CoA-transferase CaiB-like acyl-CoA transferase
MQKMIPTLEQRPLEGVRAVEFCQVAAGPFCGMLLSDYGARVVKIEPLEGDGMRAWPPTSNGYSENFASLNRGKQSIALNLKNPCDVNVARALVLESDVLIENNRPGVMDRLGLGWDWAHRHNPKLIYCSISAFGQTGPRAKEGGFDLTIQAASGIMSVTGEPDGAPVKCGVPIADFTAGLYAAFTITASLARMRAGGEGCYIDVPMFSSTLAMCALQTSEYFGTGVAPRKFGSAHPRNAPYQAFRSRDGWFALAAGNNRLWQTVCEIVELPELLQDERYATNTLRARHQIELKTILEQKFAARDTADWLTLFAKAGVPCGPINDFASALSDSQTEHLKLVRPMRLPNGKETRTVVCPVWLDGAPVNVSTHPPELNEHGEILRAGLGCKEKEMSQ